MNAQSPGAEVPTLGITCPLCGTLLDRVLFTRRATNQIFRTRKCSKCRRRVRTSEKVVSTHSPARGDTLLPPPPP